MKELGKKGYAEKDSAEILKIEKEIGIGFSNPSQVEIDLNSAEERDLFTGIATRVPRKYFGRNAFFKTYCRRQRKLWRIKRGYGDGLEFLKTYLTETQSSNHIANDRGSTGRFQGAETVTQ